MNIQLENVSKSYMSTRILHNITFNIDNISSLGIIGESGCGKSTLLRQMAGIEKSDKGSIMIDGISPFVKNKELHRQMGFVFQKANLFPHLSVRENIMLILVQIYRMDKQKAEKRLNEVLKQLHIEQIADKKPNTISGGQAQRASIARALVTDPKYICLDEPTAALDPVLTKEVLDCVLALKETGRNFIFVTHEISFLKEFADYILYMKDGRICETGDINILEMPKTKELSNFLLKH